MYNPGMEMIQIKPTLERAQKNLQTTCHSRLQGVGLSDQCRESG